LQITEGRKFKINKRTGEFLNQKAVPNKISRIEIKSLKKRIIVINLGLQSTLFGGPPILSLFHDLK
jgi:hypothetical protein